MRSVTGRGKATVPGWPFSEQFHAALGQGHGPTREGRAGSRHPGPTAGRLPLQPQSQMRATGARHRLAGGGPATLVQVLGSIPHSTLVRASVYGAPAASEALRWGLHLPEVPPWGHFMPRLAFQGSEVPVLQGPSVCVTTEGRFWKPQTGDRRNSTQSFPSALAGVPGPPGGEVRHRRGRAEPLPSLAETGTGGCPLSGCSLICKTATMFVQT